jgi:hypothetical protein
MFLETIFGAPKLLQSLSMEQHKNRAASTAEDRSKRN